MATKTANSAAGNVISIPAEVSKEYPECTDVPHVVVAGGTHGTGEPFNPCRLPKISQNSL